ncbi:MAG: hypothetical protein HY040_17860 [Planctomycetes bacterium]|nr:hypothetical protein [Planctomycetota bacterium]
MQFAKHWSKAEATAQSPRGANLPIRLWRGSTTSKEDANAQAREAVERVAQRIMRGEPFPGRYVYSTRPLREEILREFPGVGGALEAAITRNAYGAEILNAARVCFIDVDLPETPASATVQQPSSAQPAAGFWDRLLQPVLQPLLQALGQSTTTTTGGAAPTAGATEATAKAKRQQWLAAHPDWGMRVYRTRSGLRYLVTHAVFDPGGAESEAAMDFLGCDPAYRLLCRAQKSFRARLTPKPWRCGLLPPPVRFPWENEAERNRMRAWEAEYAQACKSRATCQLVEVVGNPQLHPVAAPFVKLHDERSRTESGLALA